MAADEIPPLVDQLRFFAGAARMLEGKGGGEYMAGHTSFVRREPLGVCAQVTPWNYPLMMAVWKIAPALAAGNTVVLKPAETTPETAVMLAELAAEFLPPGVLNVVCGDRDTGRALVAHPVPRLVSVTGSVRAGMEVAASAATDLKRVHLELGGNAPCIVCDDADVEAAAAGIAGAGFYNAGQDCTAATRVHRRRRPCTTSSSTLLVAEAGKKVVGGLDVPDADLGPLNSAAQLERVEGFVSPPAASRSSVVRRGARRRSRLLLRADRRRRCGAGRRDRAARGVRTGDHGAALRPASPTRRRRRTASSTACRRACGRGITRTAMRLSAALDFGCVWINTHIPLVAEMPHGGFKHSGYGKDLSMYALDDYTRVKHVMSAIE